MPGAWSGASFMAAAGNRHAGDPHLLCPDPARDYFAWPQRRTAQPDAKETARRAGGRQGQGSGGVPTAAATAVASDSGAGWQPPLHKDDAIMRGELLAGYKPAR